MIDSKIKTIQLLDALKTLEQSQLQAFLHTFECKQSPDLERFLFERSIEFEKRDLSRTYIVYDESKGVILGFYSIGLKSLQLSENTSVSKNLQKRMNMDPDSRILQTHLLGQLCRSESSAPGFGESMMNSALKVFRNVKKEVGCKLIRVDCDPIMTGYYEKHGFKSIAFNKEKNQLQMIAFI